MGTIYILEFGGQHTDLIGNRLRDMGFSFSYAPSDARVAGLQDASGIILSGGPKIVDQPDSYPFDPALFTSGIPLLGICYGMQLLGFQSGRRVAHVREYGETRMMLLARDPLFAGLSETEVVWMNHGDSLPWDGDYSVLALTEKGVPAAIRRGRKYGVQFHPEVTHTEKGKVLLRNYAERVCGLVPAPREAEEFDAESFIPEALKELREAVGGRVALVFTSGGVDSSVAAKLCSMAGLRIRPVYLEMGNGRKDEARLVERYLGAELRVPVEVHDAADAFIRELQPLHEPEERRKRFGELYAEAGIRVLRELGLNRGNAAFVDGTIATDKRETGQEAGTGSTDRGTVATIKTHHNPFAHLVLGELGDLVAPLRNLTKERVRKVARAIRLPEGISSRQPFPGPGLFVRFDTAYHPVPPDVAEGVAAIASGNGMDGYVIPRKGVGLKGDSRAYEHAALIAGERDWARVRRAGKSMIEDLPISRVLYLPRERVFSQPDEAAEFPMNRENLGMLREVTAVAEETMEKDGVRPSQAPVIAFGGPEGPVFVIRDVQSEDFRTCRPLKKPEEFPWECYDRIDRRVKESIGRPGREPMVVFDVSDKPGGTTEWM